MTTTLGVDEVFGHALRGEACYLRTPGLRRIPLPVTDWSAPCTASDEFLLQLCDGATLDVGCGPGRMTAELAARGHVTLGIDVVGDSVTLTRGRGASALRRDIFDTVPGEGRWDTALLADGNIGIGGDPAALLTRARRVLRPGGRVVVETASPGTKSRVLEARLECGCGASDLFPWAIVGLDDLAGIADRAGLRHTGSVCSGPSDMAPSAAALMRDELAPRRWAGVLTEAP